MMFGRIAGRGLAAVACVLLGLAMLCGPADSALGAAGPGWELTGRSYPTYFSPTSPSAPLVSGTIALDVFNVGAGAAGCTLVQFQAEQLEGNKVPLCSTDSPRGANPITVTDVLPQGVRAVEAGELIEPSSGGAGAEKPRLGHQLWACTGNGPGESPGVAGATIVTCRNKTTKLSEEENVQDIVPGGGGLPVRGSNNPDPVLGIAVDVRPGAHELEVNHATVAGGGAPTAATTSDPVVISSQKPRFGLAGWDGWFSSADGTLDTQAGSHPYEATFSFDLMSEVVNEGAFSKTRVSGGEVKTVEVQLPPGFVGNPTDVPQCPREVFEAEECPAASVIGVSTAYFANLANVSFPVVNLVPPPGVPAEFGFTFQGLNTYLDAGVRSGSDYGITEHVSDIAQKEVVHSVTTLWGEPGDLSHDMWRSGATGGCSTTELEGEGQRCGRTKSPFTQPFLTLPTACGGALPFTIRATSWTGATSENTFYSHDSSGPASSADAPSAIGFTGCQELGFAPTMSVSPDTGSGDTPAGLTVDVRPPLGGLSNFEGLGTSDIKGTTVTLPEGLVINPGQAGGLQACGPGEDGLTTEAERAEGKEDNGPPSCPAASKVGVVRARTPLLEGSLEKELEGSVYVLASNPPQLKLLAAFSADGVNIKLVLNVELDEQTGRITTRVQNVPEFPVSDFKLSFSGGPQAALDTPLHCGTYQANADFQPWASPFIADVFPAANFAITSGPGGGPCVADPAPFSPSLTAGSTSDQAGGYSSFSLLLQAPDGQQRIQRLSFKAPQGLAGMISSVALCGEPQAASGDCPASSQIGHTVVASGPGPYPLVVPQPGKPPAAIYLTGPYQGAPFGLSIVTPVVVGPFDLGTIVTRAKIEVDPTTAQITVTSDALPQIVRGVPTDLRTIDAVIDRPGFIFNPTNCTSQSFSGTATSAQGTQAALASHFQVGSCQALKFAPKFKAATTGKPSRANGVGLDVKLAYPKAPQGTQANITRVKVELPKRLPSRLTTLQKACAAAQFQANPAGCPQASIVGHAIVHTPVLPVPLTGPAYFVSHGGEAFPSLTIVLQGDGVTVDLVGSTFISKRGITSTTFKTVPDVPFSTFELSLPAGPYSALTANGNLCSGKLAMPTEFTAQNGLHASQTTKIAPASCTKKRAAHARRRRPGHAKRRR